MILVDGSVLVAFLRGDADESADPLAEARSQGFTVGIDPNLFQEVLQGARDEQEWRLLEGYLSTQRMLRLQRGLASHRDAARIHHDCRRRGPTVRSLVDCLIAQTAIENGVALLARYRDHAAIARVRPLRLWP